ncbi:MAG: OmpH family outer membrane protein [Chitinophagia bacterium]|nr:OmpH family outer membrane protein [Chitinophagia bacterium]
MKSVLITVACFLMAFTTTFAQPKKTATGGTVPNSTTTAENVDAAAKAGLKIGFINSAELLSAMPQKVKADSDIAKYAREFQTQIETMMKEYQAKTQDYDAKSKTMSDAIKEVKINEIQSLQQRIEALQQTAREKVEMKKQELYQPVLEKADKAIKDVAKEKDYDFIFDANGSTLLFGKDAYNITSLVKAKLGIK